MTHIPVLFGYNEVLNQHTVSSPVNCPDVIFYVDGLFGSVELEPSSWKAWVQYHLTVEGQIIREAAEELGQRIRKEKFDDRSPEKGLEALNETQTQDAD